MPGIFNRMAGLHSRTGWAVFATALAAACLIPLLNLGLEPDSPMHVSDYLVTLFGKYICYAMLALSLDLIWGFAGVLSLGQGAFFALGGYAMGMYLMRQIGERSVYGHPVLPDFMVFLNWKELPWYWYGMDHFAIAALMIVLVPGLLAFVFGWLAFRSRISGVYFAIISQAMTFALLLAFFRNDMGFGGNNGLTDFKELLGFDLGSSATRAGLYLLSVMALSGGYLLCRFVVSSKLGRVATGIRDSESRLRFLGYTTERFNLFLFTLSAVLAGIAGALYVPQVGIINPSEFSPANSIEVAIWVAVGGRGTLYGAVLGGLSVNATKSYLTSSLPEIWLFFLGALFICSTLFAPRGLVGIGAQLKARWKRAAAVKEVTGDGAD